jgi:hypothetical protein
MRGRFRDQGKLFSYLSLESRVPAEHPLRRVSPTRQGGCKIRQPLIEGERELPGEFARGATEVMEATDAATLRLHRRRRINRRLAGVWIRPSRQDRFGSRLWGRPALGVKNV